MTPTARLSGNPGGERVSGEPAAARLAAGASLLISALPVAMALANRSAPLILLLAAFIVLACVVTGGGWSSIRAGFADFRHSPVTWASAAFIGLSLLSWLWSVDRAQSWRTLEEGAVPILAGAVLLCFLPRIASPWTGPAVALGMIVAGLISIGELRSGMPIRKALHLRAIAFEYNRPVLTLLALFWPLCALAASWRDTSASGVRDRASLLPHSSAPILHAFDGGTMRVVFWAALAITSIAIWISQSGTAMFAQALSVTAALLASRFPRAVLLVLAIGVILVFASIFVFGDLAWRLLPASIYELLAWAHAADRVEIWRSFGAAARFHPLIGAGIGTSVTLGDSAVAGEVTSEFRRMLSVGHPHNGYLQIGVELGALGCAIAVAIVLSMLRSWRDLAGPPLWSRIGLFTMVAAAMLVGHGAWQAWWLAVTFVAAALIRTLAPSPPRTR